LEELLSRLGIQQGSTLVDVGFGREDELRDLADIVGDEGKVYGIEPLKDRVDEEGKNLRSVRSIAVLNGNILSIPLPNRSADYVLLKGVLHEVPNVSKALSEAARICKQEGTILIVDFKVFPKFWLTKSNLKSRLRGLRKLLGKPLDRHPGFSRTRIEAYLKSAGLKMRSYDENIATGGFGGHSIPLFLAVGERA
jgi:ubiquinone/menaquinone biosynthesis C-methylase UbiE